MGELEFHEAANIFPLDEEHLDELAADIRQNGQLVPIELFGGKILDGRRRWLACEKVGIEPITREVNPADPVVYVLSLNLHRRHLDKGQRAMVGARAKEVYAQQARERQATGKGSDGSGGRGNKKNLPTKTTEGLGGDTRAVIGKAVGVGGTTIDQASKVLEQGVPELVNAVDSGRMPVYTAAKIASMPEEEQRREIKNPKPRPSNQHTNGAAKGSHAEPPPLDRNKKKLTCDAIDLANEAINCLIRIPKNDPKRKRGFQIVTDWIKLHK